MRILLVEDEKKLTDAIAHILKQNNMDVDVANDGDYGLILAEREIYDVLVLDIMLPGKSGLEILREIRKKGNMTPVLILTARDAIKDRVDGLDLGADDYLVKPFAMAELQARIRALGRRVPAIFTGNIISAGNVELDMDNLLLCIEDEKSNISLKEAHLLELLMKRPGMVLSRELILDHVWGHEVDIQENNVEIYVHHLRKKMSKKANMVIHTVRGVGYTLRENK